MPTQNGAVIDSGPAPAPINPETVSLTERGRNLLALLACRDILPLTTSSVIRAAIDRRINTLLGDDIGAD